MIVIVKSRVETFDTGFDDDDQFAETGGFYDIKGSDDESSQEDKKKKKKKDKKKKKKSSSRLNPDHEDPFYIGGGHVRPGDVSVDDVPVVRLSKKELKNDKKKKKKKSRKVGRADVYVEDSLPDGVSDDEGKRRGAASSSICGRRPRAPRLARAVDATPSLATQEEEGQEEEARRRRRGRGPRRPGPVAD